MQFTSSNKIWQDQYAIHIYHIDKYGLTTMASICDFLQESAWAHANSGKFGFDDLKEQNLMWVLSRILIKVHRFPKWKEKITVNTWSKGTLGIFADRDFEVFDEEGKLIVSATSSWLTLDTVTRRVKRIIGLKDRLPAYPEKNALPCRADKIAEPENSMLGPFCPVLFSDLDLNNHVNNARYIRRIFDSFNSDLRGEYQPDEMEINFLKEGACGDELAVSQSSFEANSHVCSIVRSSDKAELVRMRILWQKRE